VNRALNSAIRSGRWRLFLIVAGGCALALPVPAQDAREEARAILEKAIANKQQPDELKSALAQLEALANRSAPDSLTEYARGWVLSHLERPDDAIAAYRRSIGLDDNLSEAHYNLGVLLGKKGAPEDALRSYAEALRVDPKHVDAAYNAAQVNYNLERYGAALEKWRLAQKLAPDDSQIARKIVQVQNALGLWEEAAIARDNLRRILREQLDPAAKNVTRYCFDQVPLEAGRVFAYEYIETAKAAPRVYQFVITDVSQGKTLAEMELSASEGSRHLLRVIKPADKFPPREFTDLPPWRELKPVVRELARALLQPPKD
jgi:tetratricopeptide (TPR) repeat protein